VLVAGTVVVVGGATVVVVVAGTVVVVVLGERCRFGGTVVVVVVVDVVEVVEVEGGAGGVEYAGAGACSSGERSPVVTVTSVPTGSIG
jgi:hypothetical protein